MSKNYKKMFETLNEYLKNKIEDIDQTIIEAVNARNNGKCFSSQEHLKGFVYAQLSALVSWKNIKAHHTELDFLFCNFEKDRLKEIAPEILIEKIRELKCYNPYTTKNQMTFLKNNIETFEKIEDKYGSLDKFITHSTPANIVKLLADSNSNYKLKYAGVALVCEYLRNVGIDIVKPDVHIKRIVGADRLNLIQSKSDYKIIEEFRRLSAEIGISQVKMDYLLWNYCSKGYGEICTAKPKCYECVIKEYCNDFLLNNKFNIPKNKQMSVIDEIEEFIKDFPVGYEFSTTWFKKELNKKYNRSEGSYIPSDYCYNRKNKGINYNKQPHYFLYIERNKYKYVGKDYVYNGEIEYNPKKK